jgi:hypothetical protein
MKEEEEEEEEDIDMSCMRRGDLKIDWFRGCC